jgi:spore germination cell wall hydrolase CwlJ-like protein
MKDLKCLALNVYHEARGESFLGQVLVAKTTLNRVDSPDFPKAVCDVVYQPNQFSWTLVKQKQPTLEQLEIAVKAVYVALDHPSNALYFHATTVKPQWSKHKEYLYKEGNHVFYR